MVTTHVFIAVSLDGYIARQDGDIDWLLQRDDPTEDHGYAAFIADKDWIVMGRGSYEKALTFDQWPYDRPVLVLSRQLSDIAIPEALKGKVQLSSRTPGEVLADLALQNAHRVYLDGGLVIQSFLREGLVADMIITTYRSCPARCGKTAVRFPDKGYRFDAVIKPQLPFGSGAVALSADVINCINT